MIDLITHAELSSTIAGAIVAHPSFLIKEEANQIKRPILFICAENDAIFTAEIKEVFQKELTSNGLGQFLDYPGTTHGFVVRPEDDQIVFQQRDKAVQDAILFFNQHF